MPVRCVRICGTISAAACDGKCNKAWGINARPKVQLSEDDDDYAFLADGELGEAPEDPGTYEGGDAKPRPGQARLNKWCLRECERHVFADIGEPVEEFPDFSKRRYNIPSSEPAQAGAALDGQKGESHG